MDRAILPASNLGTWNPETSEAIIHELSICAGLSQERAGISQIAARGFQLEVRKDEGAIKIEKSKNSSESMPRGLESDGMFASFSSDPGLENHTH